MVLPGQGAMPDCMRELRESGLQESVLEAAATKPLFGVCVGMQMLLDHSAEGPGHAGPGPDPGRGAQVRPGGQTQPDGSRFKVPQMGWNQVRQVPHAHAGGAVHPVWAGVPDNSYFYFVHSFYARRERATVQARPTTAAALPPPLRAIIFLPRSFTPKKARSTAWPCTATFLHWNP
jgi:glutamine amidotransferase